MDKRGGLHTRSKTQESYKPHVNDVRFRFHNVQGLTDKRFRQYYLNTARSNCEILALAETNCPDDATAHLWAKDWQGSGGTFWATAPHKCRGMAILLSSTLGDTGAHVVWKDPLGNSIIETGYQNELSLQVSFLFE